MATQISNQARLTYISGGTARAAASNVATATIADSLEAAKTSVETAYRANDEITYILSAVNNCCCSDTTVTITDNLGTYSPEGCPAAVTPLTYEEAVLYIDGVQSAALGVTASSDKVVFTVPALASGSSAIIVYKATVNDYAELAVGSTIENQAVFDYNCTAAASVSVTHSLPVESYADIGIVKSMNTSASCGAISYSFTITNSGNIEATDVVLTDTFDPAPTITSITVDGELMSAADYGYTDGALTLPATGSTMTITVPAATISSDCDGTSVTPAAVEIAVNGTL